MHLYNLEGFPSKLPYNLHCLIPPKIGNLMTLGFKLMVSLLAPDQNKTNSSPLKKRKAGVGRSELSLELAYFLGAPMSVAKGYNSTG